MFVQLKLWHELIMNKLTNFTAWERRRMLTPQCSEERFGITFNASTAFDTMTTITEKWMNSWLEISRSTSRMFVVSLTKSVRKTVTASCLSFGDLRRFVLPLFSLSLINSNELHYPSFTDPCQSDDFRGENASSSTLCLEGCHEIHDIINNYGIKWN